MGDINYKYKMNLWLDDLEWKRINQPRKYFLREGVCLVIFVKRFFG